MLYFFFFFWQISLMSGLAEGSWIVISAYAFNLLQFVVLVEVYEEKQPHTDMSLDKGRVF